MSRRGPQGAGRPAFLLRNAQMFDTAVAWVAKDLRLKVRDIVGPLKLRELVGARHLCMAGLYRAGLSYSDIGRRFGRHHSSVAAGVENLLTQSTTDPELARMIEMVRVASTIPSTTKTSALA